MSSKFLDEYPNILLVKNTYNICNIYDSNTCNDFIRFYGVYCNLNPFLSYGIIYYIIYYIIIHSCKKVNLSTSLKSTQLVLSVTQW